MNLTPDLPLGAAVLVVLGMGFVSGLSPCTLPTVIFVTSYVHRKGKPSRKAGLILSTAFVMGLLVTFVVLGALAGRLGEFLQYARVLNYVVAAIMIITALWLLRVIDADALLPAGRLYRFQNGGVLGAFVLGMPFALSASPCTFPVTLAVLAYVAGRAQPGVGALLMGVFGLGRSLPLWIAAVFSGSLARFQTAARFQPVIEKVAAVLIFGAAAWLLWTA